MSTQDQTSTPFTIAADQQSFKLLELPPGLLEVITSSAPPPIKIKSQDAGHAVLCTPTQTWQLRQVQTSNSVFITRAVPFQKSHDMITTSSVSAISSCNHTLELHPISASALPLLQTLLPEYQESEDIKLPNSRARSQEEIFANLTFSDAECNQAWKELCAFEVSGRSWRPSAAAIVKAWQTIMLAAIAEGIRLESTFLLEDVERVLEGEEAPIELFKAILLFNCSDAEGGNGRTLNKDVCLPWLGRHILEAQTEHESELQLTQFLATWRDALPELWRSSAQVNLIKDFCDQPSQSTIRVRASSNKSSSQATTANPGIKARKWHEKFKAARR